MTLKTPAEIAAQAARDLLAAHDLKQEYVNENPLESLGWEMGEGIGYAAALEEIVQRAIEVDREQWRFDSAELQATLDRFNEATTSAEINDSAREMYDIVNRLHTHAIDQDFQESK